MTFLIIDVLKVVDINKKDREFFLITLSPAHLLG